jgi:AcrR family transcriptional regulator
LSLPPNRNSRKRKYDSTVRAQSAAATRHAIVDSARRLFLEKGYAATTMPDIAKAAGTALDTVYATVGKKPALFRLLIETAISGADRAVPAEQRGYVRAIRAEPDAARKIHLYADAMRVIQPRLAPLVRVLQGAAPLDPELNDLWQSIAQRRIDNMRLLVEDLATTGRLRSGLSESKAADLVWSMNSPEFYSLLVEQRHWPVQEYAEWLRDAWIQLLLEP